MRRGAPEPSTEDLRRWARLIDAARRQAGAPMAYAGDLAKRAKTAGRAVIPPRHCVRGGVFVRLVELGKVWAGLDRDQRVTRAGELLALADAVAAALDEDRDGRARADLDG